MRYKCPHCGSNCISFTRKLSAGMEKGAECSVCGQRVCLPGYCVPLLALLVYASCLVPICALVFISPWAALLTFVGCLALAFAIFHFTPLRPLTATRPAHTTTSPGVSRNFQETPPAYRRTDPQATPVAGVEVECPQCGRKEFIPQQEFVHALPSIHASAPPPPDVRIRYSGDSIRHLPPRTARWLAPICTGIIAFLCAMFNGLDPAMSCSVAVAAALIGGLGGLGLMKALGEAAAFSVAGKDIPVWLLPCPQCGTEIPVASDGELFFVCTDQAVAGTPTTETPQPAVEPPALEPAPATETGGGEEAEPEAGPPSHPTPEKRVVRGVPRRPPVVALLNLTGLGLGYLYMHRWLRWGVHFLLTAGLLATAPYTGNIFAPAFWWSIVGLWLLWMAFDGWRKARELVQANPEGVTGHRWLPIVGAALVICLELACLWAYRSAGQRNFALGMAAYREMDCATAVEYLNRVDLFYRPVLPSEASTARERSRECALINNAVTAYEDHNYDAATTWYKRYLSIFPRGDLIPQVQEEVAAICVEWGLSLQAQGEYRQALRTLSDLEGYPHTSAGQQAASLIAGVCMEWGDELRAAGDYEEAIRRYQTFLDMYPAAEEASAVAKAIGQTYNEWGRYLLSQQEYAAAMEKFTLARQATDDPDTIAAADEGYNEAVWTLGEDRGSVGREILENTAESICTGHPAISPAVGIAEDEPGRVMLYGVSPAPIPLSSMRAQKPAHLRYVVCITEEFIDVEECTYIPLGTLVRQQRVWRVTVHDARTGQVINEETFYGDLPPECPFAHSFESLVEYSRGASPGSELLTWLETIVQ